MLWRLKGFLFFNLYILNGAASVIQHGWAKPAHLSQTFRVCTFTLTRICQYSQHVGCDVHPKLVQCKPDSQSLTWCIIVQSCPLFAKQERDRLFFFLQLKGASRKGDVEWFQHRSSETIIFCFCFFHFINLLYSNWPKAYILLQQSLQFGKKMIQ